MRILISGCSSGIGRDTAAYLASAGHQVVATARNIEALQGLDVEQRLALDVTDPAQVADAVGRSGAIDVLINNAGLGMWGPVERADPRHVQQIFATNVMAPIAMSQAVLPQMRKRGSGLIVQISSGAARRSRPLVGVYSATKAALEAASHALRIELAPTGVKVAVLSMGAVESDIDANRIADSAAGSFYEDMCGRMTASIREMRRSALPASAVSQALAALVEHPSPPFRNYVDEAYEQRLNETVALSDDAFEEDMCRLLYPGFRERQP